MIKTFRCRHTAKLHTGERSRRFQGIETVARRKLRHLDTAVGLRDLAVFPGNRLEALKGDRARQHSVRINDQWRLCFEWREGDAYNVEIVDYH